MRTIELEVLPACRAHGLGVIPWSPLASGALAGVLGERGKGRRSRDLVSEKIQKHRPQIEAWEKFCAERGEQPADVALAWTLANPVVTAPIVGPRTMEQLTGALRALEIRLDAAAMKRLDEIWPGPGGEAPEAYAW
jgi:aryl-alcohol dehydrogenase-like predicted oxidoreductase